MFNPSRTQARDLFFDAWRKYRAAEPLTALETMAVELIAEHPEYHPLLEDRDRNIDRDYRPEDGQINPFLHLSVHIAIREQLSIDQPAGVRAEYERLCQKHDDVHAAEHDMMDCLIEMIWSAQRNRTAPDSSIYFACLAKK